MASCSGRAKVIKSHDISPFSNDIREGVDSMGVRVIPEEGLILLEMIELYFFAKRKKIGRVEKLQQRLIFLYL